MESARIKPIFPLARLMPLSFLTAFAIVCALLIQISGIGSNGWAALGVLPLALYLGNRKLRAKKLLLAEKGREREIVEAGFVVMAAERTARFWGIVFSAIAVATIVTACAVWAYQAFLWLDQERWVAVTWLNVVRSIPDTGYPLLQKSVYWLGDTNFGVIVLVTGLIIAAPVAAIHWRANNKVTFRRNDLANLKKRS